MAAGRTYDILLCDAEESNRQRWPHALISHLEQARVGVFADARSALTSFSRARFDTVVCGTSLADTDCWRFIRMVRSGRFGFPDTPVFVSCGPEEEAALQPILDPYTRLIPSDDADTIAEHVSTFGVNRILASVLVIEDEPEAAQAATRSLEKHFEVELAHSGDVGLQAWRTRRHKLVLLDLMLPGMPGAEVLKAILADDPDQPVMIITALSATERHQDLMLAGATEFLAKPLDLHYLAANCQRVLRDRACLTGAATALGRAQAYEKLAARVHAANYTLKSGRTAEATRHLEQALRACRAKGPSDDQWAALLEEFSFPRGPPG